ncbi:VWA domain-containing protein [Aquihabitans sp. G128]|uniref:vWA domain-containing protein n=1 Tax=Aquihabitans sp. G128 TaxID=2849779 RepID=UPI001C242D1A|nr:vWA domain-containing protein [Aquihabitans sp. G128]QXC63344.1 VWA domain-containing protein [Aquihabitans sp. G128]
MLEGDAAQEAVAEAGRRTVSRRDLARHQRFDQVSKEVGTLDEGQFDDLLEEAPDDALALLADLNGATDERLRALAHRLSARVVVDLARSATSTTRRGVGRLERARADRAAGDLDLDGSLDAIVAARRGGLPPRAEDLSVSAWRRPATAVCLLVDRSGSMTGERLATAAVTAAAVALRAGDDCSVVAFGSEAIVLGSQGQPRPPGDLVVDLCRLRGFGTTDVGLALRAAAWQLSRSGAERRLTILLSDCRATAGGDPLDDAHALDELVVLTPGDDTADAQAFARAAGVRWAPLHGPSSAPAALDELLGDR